MLVHAVTANVTYEFAADVRAGLTKPGRRNCFRSICTTTSARHYSR